MSRRLEKQKRSRQFIGIDLFCGVGGMSLGFEQAGFRVVAAVDLSKLNVETHERNFPKTKAIHADLRKLKGFELRKKAGLGRRRVDVVFGGPPCQGFSVGGKQQLDDPRNQLLMEFARLVVEIQPRYFVMENVAGLLGEQYQPLLRKFKRRLAEGGYDIIEPLTRLDAADFGVPQRRKRVFVLGCRHGEKKPSYPKASANRVTVAAAIGDLKRVDFSKVSEKGVYEGGLGRPSSYAKKLRIPRRGSNNKNRAVLTGLASTEHSDNVVRRFKRVKPGGNDPISRFIRLDPDGVSPTLRAGTGADNGRFMAPRPIHPQAARCITVREAARLHSFPDWFVFHETKWNGFMQVGNSVPPAFAKAVAEQVRNSLKG